MQKNSPKFSYWVFPIAIVNIRLVIGKFKIVKKNPFEKCEVQLMSLYYKNVEAIGKCEKWQKFSLGKKYTSPADRFLLVHTDRKIEKK